MLSSLVFVTLFPRVGQDFASYSGLCEEKLQGFTMGSKRSLGCLSINHWHFLAGPLEILCGDVEYLFLDYFTTL